MLTRGDRPETEGSVGGELTASRLGPSGAGVVVGPVTGDCERERACCCGLEGVVAEKHEQIDSLKAGFPVHKSQTNQINKLLTGRSSD